MSMIKDQFFEEIFAMVEPREAELEEQYWYELKERREMYLAFVTKQVMAKPESHWFSQDFEAWMNEESSKKVAETLIKQRNAGNPTTDMDFDLNPVREDENHQRRNHNFDNSFI